MNITIDIPALDKIARSFGETVTIAKHASQTLDRILAAITRIAPGRPVTAQLHVYVGGKIMSNTLTIKDTDPGAVATVTFQDADGQPTTPDPGDVPTWPVDDPNGAATATVSDDGLTLTLVPTGTAIGALTFHVELVEAATGNTIVTETGTLTITGGEPTQGTVDLQPLPAA